MIFKCYKMFKTLVINMLIIKVINLYNQIIKSQNKYLKFEIFIMVLKSYEQNKKVINKMHFKKRKLELYR